MAINLKIPESKELRPRITVLGVGGAGGNAVNNMIGSRLEGVDFVVANTDAQALSQSKAERRIQLGATTTEGLGAGAQPDVGRAGAEESMPEIMEQLSGSHMVFITAGMGGGTGTGAAPVISEMGKAMMGTGEAEGEDRAQRAADMAICNPLLDDVTMKGARGVLINITGGPDLMLFEVEQAANRIRAEVDPDANIIFGNTILDDMEGRIRVSVVATGIDAELTKMPLPEKVRALHPHLNLKSPARVAQPAPVPAAPQPVANPVHVTMEALASQMNA